MLTKEDIATAKEIAKVLRESGVDELTVAGQLITVLLAEREQQRTAAEGEDTRRAWVGLDPEEIRKTNHHMVDGAYHYSFKQGAEWAETKLKEKNNVSQ